jgi:branched-chain amino acid transport system substrate-binding protein
MRSANYRAGFEKYLPLLLVLVLALSVAGCAPPPAAPPTAAPAPTAAPPEPTKAPEAPTAAPVEPTKAPEPAALEVFKLGVQGPFSGPSARVGEEFKGSVNMAFDAVNWTLCGKYKVEPVWIDCQSDPAKGSQAYEQAVVQDKIQAGILNWHSSVAVSLMDITAKYKIPHFFGFGATEVVNEKFASDPAKYGYWMFKGWPSPSKLSISYVQALEDAIASGTWKPEKKTVAIYGEDTDWGRSFGGAIKKQLQDKGWEVVAEEWFPLDQTEFYPLLNKLKDLNPALIAGTSTAAPAMSAFIKQADEVGLQGLIIADGLGWVGEWYDLTGSSSNYVLDQIPGWATAEGKKFAADFEKRFSIQPSPSAAGLSYDGTRFFIALAEDICKQTGGTLNSETIYNFVKDNVWTGKWAFKDGIVMSNYSATPDTVPDPVVGKGYYIFPVLQYMDGKGNIIYPPEWAEGKLQAKPAK